MKKTLPILWAVLLIAGLGMWGGPAVYDTVAEWSGWEAVGGKLDMVVAVYESDNEPVDELSVLAGNTSRALRKAGKWRQYDQNKLPQKLMPTLEPVVAKLGVPCITLIRSGKVVASVKLPKTDAELAALIAKKGGF